MCLQILGFIAKGSFGPILKVKDISKEKIYAVKVNPVLTKDVKNVILLDIFSVIFFLCCHTGSAKV